LSPLITPVIEQRLGFTGAFALPAFVFLVAFAVLFLGKDRYKSFPPEGSIMTKAVRYLWLIMTSKGSFARAKEYVNSCHAAGQTPPWDDDFAADLHLTLQACKIFCFYPMYWLVFAQSMTSLISQAATMETHGIPNDLLVVLNPIAILVLGPTFEFFVYPALHRIGIQFQPITRIACGFIFIGLSMAYAAALQYAIYASPPCYSYPLSLDCEDGKVPNQICVQAGSTDHAIARHGCISIYSSRSISFGNDYCAIFYRPNTGVGLFRVKCRRIFHRCYVLEDIWGQS
jgi:POT family proton-dependent oligopeptide transporter